MRNDKLIPGIILVMIGGIFLLNNFGYIDFHWGNIFHLWPIFLVIGGVNLVFANNRSVWATVLKITVIVLGFGLLLFGNFGRNREYWPHAFYQYNDDDNDDDDSTDVKGGVVKVEGNSIFNEPYSPAIRVAKLNISGGGATYTLSDTTSQLFKADTKEFYGRYQFSHTSQDSVAVLDFDMKNKSGRHFNWGKDKSNSANFRLNSNPEWEINVKTGATKLDFDLSKFKVRSLQLNGGAASFDIKLGQPLAATRVDVSTGVSEVTISIPQSAACSITTDSGLSSTTFNGFTKKADNTYETTGFSNAKNKILIKMSGGISDFNVKRY